MNYIGPGEGEGIRVYFNGMLILSDSTRRETSHSTEDGRIVLGRYYTYKNQDYTTMTIDELSFFNKSLNLDEIITLYGGAGSKI